MSISIRLRRVAAELIAIADAIDFPFAEGAEKILPAEYVPVKILAASLRCSEKTARKIGAQCGARIVVGGRIYFNRAVVAASYRDLPTFAVSNETDMGDS